MIKIAILTNIIPKYRQGFYYNIFSNENFDVHVYCQKEIKGGNYETIHHLHNENIHEVNHLSLKREAISWQFLPMYRIFKDFDVIFIDGNPRNISHAIFATLLRILNKKVVLWSMFHSFRNNKLTERIRHKWLRIFKYHFLYNDNEIKLLKNIKGFEKKFVSAMNNGLDQRKIDSESEKWNSEKLEVWKRNQYGISNTIDIITLGRLEHGKYEILLDALEILRDKNFPVSCCIIGNGPAMSNLCSIVEDKGLGNLVYFVGAIHEDEILAPYLLSAKILVHPTAVGLSIMHCFGYGLPIITHNKYEAHGPEIIAFENNVNGLSFQYMDTADLAKKVEYLLSNENLLESFSSNALSVVRTKYNTDIMAERFLTMTETVFYDK